MIALKALGITIGLLLAVTLVLVAGLFYMNAVGVMGTCATLIFVCCYIGVLDYLKENK